ncbi:hypothetical protein NCC49_000971 [Naganishia albida]|nr:hypothetical protein NCC49_000971 [Naganishia albida]
MAADIFFGGARVARVLADPALAELSAASSNAFLFAAICSRMETLLGDFGGAKPSDDELELRKAPTDTCERSVAFGLLTGDPRSSREDAVVRRRDDVDPVGRAVFEATFKVAGLGDPTELDDGLLMRLGEGGAAGALVVLDETGSLAVRAGVTGTVLITPRDSLLLDAGTFAGIADGVAREILGEEAEVDGWGIRETLGDEGSGIRLVRAGSEVDVIAPSYWSC